MKTLMETLIVETLVPRLGIDPATPNEPSPVKSQAADLKKAIYAICDAPDGTIVLYRGQALRILKQHPANPDQGTQLLAHPGALVAAQIVLAPEDEPSQYLVVQYAVVHNLRARDQTASEDAGPVPRYFFEVSGNPTTILAYNNLLPVTVPDPQSGATPPFPSSSRRVMRQLHRELFDFLDGVARGVTGSARSVYWPRTRRLIAEENFDVVRAQYCCYLPVEDVPLFLQFMTLIFSQRIAMGDGVITIAEHLGLRFRAYTDEETHRVVGVLFEKRHGKNSVFSVSFYDKRKRVALMRQGKTLTATEADVVANNVRVDMTLHGPGIIQMIGEAQSALQRHRKKLPEFLEDLPAQPFLDAVPDQTSWLLLRAIHVLSHRFEGEVMRRKSFSSWILPKMLREVLRLTSIVQVTPEKLRAFCALTDPLAVAWRNVTEYDPAGWCAQLVAASGCGKNVVYDRRRQWLAKYQVDIAVPYVFFRDLEVLGPNSFAAPETREALLNALGEGDGDETLRLLREAADSFFARMSELVGTAVTSLPTPLPLKIASVAASKASDGANGESDVEIGPGLPLLPSPKPLRTGSPKKSPPRRPGHRPKPKPPAR
jgi:hypothetical protein